jgi:glutamate dehydrogenase
VIGVGDMSGDVFGNGMLQSRCIRLLAAFDHRHIFIDPNPDPTISFAERRRLFDLPRSSWADYDPKLISPGGGVFPRTAKSIDLTPEIRALTGLDAEHIPPAELVRALLKAEADLLFFGGIGTYVKGVHESNAEVGDRANDSLRVDGRALRARVVGEGANLACTQIGRIEYAEAGGRINMDAIDNSAGVDCSDHEVNIKIALRQPLQDGLLSMEARNDLLGAMTEEVAELVLRDNELQTLAISLEQKCAVPDLDWHTRLMRELEREGRLNRAVEFLPDDEELARRATAGLGLTRPEIAVVLSYAKVSLFDALCTSSVPDEDRFLADLEAYFPHPLRERFPDALTHHRLRREIVATALSNEIANRGGAAFASRLREESGAGAADVTRAFALVRAAFRLPELWAGLDALDGRIPAGTLLSLYADLRAFLHRQALWTVRNLRHPIALTEALDAFVPGVSALAETVGAALPAPGAQALAAYRTEVGAAGLPPELAEQFACLRPLDAAFDIVQVARAHGRPVEDAAQAYFTLGARLGIDRLKAGITRLEPKDHWERLAIQAAVEDLYAEQRALTAKALGASDRPGAQAVEDWFAADQDDIVRAQRAIAEFDTGGALSLPKLTLAGRLLRGLAVPA